MGKYLLEDEADPLKVWFINCYKVTMMNNLALKMLMEIKSHKVTVKIMQTQGVGMVEHKVEDPRRHSRYHIDTKH